MSSSWFAARLRNLGQFLRGQILAVPRIEPYLQSIAEQRWHAGFWSPIYFGNQSKIGIREEIPP
jgi:hypothetical protein